MTRSRRLPYLWRRAPESLVARIPPTVARVGEEGVEGYELATLGEGLLEVLPGAAGLDGAGEVLPGMFEDSVQAVEL